MDGLTGLGAQHPCSSACAPAPTTRSRPRWSTIGSPAVVLVDPHVYPTRSATLRALRTQAVERLRPARVAALGHRRARAASSGASASSATAGKTEPQGEGREAPPVASYRSATRALVERGVQILAIYSGIHGANYNHADQLFELFPELRGKVDRVYFPHANHTFTELDEQAELIASSPRAGSHARFR